MIPLSVIKPIETMEELDRAAAVIEHTDPDSLDEIGKNLYATLLLLIDIFDAQFRKPKPTGAKLLKTVMNAFALKQPEIAEIMGTKQPNVSLILQEKRPITAEQDERLAAHFKMVRGAFCHRGSGSHDGCNR